MAQFRLILTSKGTVAAWTRAALKTAHPEAILARLVNKSSHRRPHPRLRLRGDQRFARQQRRQGTCQVVGPRPRADEGAPCLLMVPTLVARGSALNRAREEGDGVRGCLFVPDLSHPVQGRAEAAARWHLGRRSKQSAERTRRLTRGKRRFVSMSSNPALVFPQCLDLALCHSIM
jgi:hypothetical protein